MSMGTGKSRVAIERMKVCMEHAKQAGKTPIFVISCPVVLLPDRKALNPGGWMGEIHKWWGDPLPQLYMDTRGTSTDRAKELVNLLKEHATLFKGVPLVLAQSYESWRQPALTAILSAIGRTGSFYKMLICDESHRCKTPTSATSKAMHKFALPCDEVLLLTGTPMPHSPLDLWSQAKMVSDVYGPNYHAFKTRYANFQDRKVGVMPGGGERRANVFVGMKDHMAGEFMDRMDTFTYTLLLKDALDLPPVTTNDINVSLSPAEYKIYRDMEKKLYAELEEEVNVTAPNVLSKISKLSQITGGSIKLEDGSVKEIGTSKVEVLAELLSNDIPESEPVVVFCRFIADIDKVKARVKSIGRMVYELSGRRKELEPWRAATDGSVIVVQESAGGVGIDLTRSHYVIYYSINYSLGDLDQSFARVYRKGQTMPVTAVNLVAGGTIDEVIRESVINKRNIVEAVLGIAGVKQNRAVSISDESVELPADDGLTEEVREELRAWG
jgi:SNF2 family DNA or RNA helicase